MVPLNRAPFCLSLKTVSLCALSAHFPDYALGAELAVGAGVGTGLAVLEAFLAVADRHLLALDKGLTARVIPACHDSSFILHYLSFSQLTILSRGIRLPSQGNSNGA